MTRTEPMIRDHLQIPLLILSKFNELTSISLKSSENVRFSYDYWNLLKKTFMENFIFVQ